jgi:hypothetical protein
MSEARTIIATEPTQSIAYNQDDSPAFTLASTMLYKSNLPSIPHFFVCFHFLSPSAVAPQFLNWITSLLISPLPPR